MQLGPGLCRDAVHAQLAAARSNGNDCDAALAQCFAWVVEEFPEEIVLWGLSGGLGEVPWSNANFQRCVRASTLALRDLRSQVVAGSWMVAADNGLGKVARKQITLSVYPSYIPIKV